MFDLVISITRSVLIWASWNMQIRWTWMKSLMNLKTVPIKLFILELRPLDCWKRLFATFSSDQTSQNLICKMGLKLGIQLDHEVMQRILVTKFWYCYLYFISYVFQINDCCRHSVTLTYFSAQVRIKDHHGPLVTFLFSKWTILRHWSLSKCAS